MISKIAVLISAAIFAQVFLLIPTAHSQEVPILSYSVEEKNYVYANGMLVASFEGGEAKYYHQDQRGNIKAITDSAGDVVYQADYAPFGGTFNVQGSSDRGFVAKETDLTGLAYFGARYYDASLGRFLAFDPLADHVSNPYSYAANNPLRYIDLDGRKEKDAKSISFMSSGMTSEEKRLMDNVYVFLDQKPVFVKYIKEFERLSGVSKPIVAKASLYSDSEGIIFGTWNPIEGTDPRKPDYAIFLDLTSIELYQQTILNFGPYGNPFWGVDYIMNLENLVKQVLTHELGHIVHYLRVTGGDETRNRDYYKLDQTIKEKEAMRVQKEILGICWGFDLTAIMEQDFRNARRHIKNELNEQGSKDATLEK